MGLNDLTLEKLIGEINGYKEKMRTIHEDYGRASQELQDRINVLGYNLNEQLKTTKDQIASTPQRLLNLETKYVTGEVGEQEYHEQREEFKALLQRNLKSIEEIRSMITVLSSIESRPLSPTEIKHAYPATIPRTVSGEDWGRGDFSQDKSSSITVSQPSTTQTLNPGQTTPRFAPETFAPERNTPVDSSTPKSSPSPPQPQSNGNNWSNPSQQTNAHATILPAPIAAQAPTTETQTTAISPATPETLVAAPSIDTGPTPEESPVTVPTFDIVEAGGSDDALMVKVVDDIASVEASAAVAPSDTAQLQPTVMGGTESITMAPPTTDIAQVSLTPPTQFYKVVCPKCGADVPKPVKVWELKGGKSKKNVLIGLFQCQDCRVKFREALTREII